MGVDQSRYQCENNLGLKPNKIKAVGDKGSLINLIARQDWQQVLVRTSTHPHELHRLQKVRLFGVNRMLLPLHLACAMKPPIQAIDLMLKNMQSSIRTYARSVLFISLKILIKLDC